jgi:hypothetical protein
LFLRDRCALPDFYAIDGDFRAFLAAQVATRVAVSGLAYGF